MAKMRGFKPEIWTDDKFVELSPLARLLFMGMWNYSCDNGHVEDKPAQLKMRILPADSCNVAELIDEMVEQGMVRRSKKCLTIPNLPLHQRLDKRYFTSCEHCPHDESTAGARRESDGDSRDISKSRMKEGSERKERKARSERDALEPKDDRFDEFWSLYPRKAEKVKARKAWAKATKTNAADQILDGLRAHLPGWANTEQRFIPHATTWLNGERWNDEIDGTASNDFFAGPHVVNLDEAR